MSTKRFKSSAEVVAGMALVGALLAGSWGDGPGD